MNNKPFHFKHFSMMHNHSTMRIGTDAVLLGRWVDVGQSDRVLDVGTGCGVIAMMLAQRGALCVDAIDLDENSAQEADLNFRTSQWSDRLNAYNADVRTFDKRVRYDLIVSNPPFFVNSSKCDAERRSMARHAGVTLSFSDLFVSAKRLLVEDGRLAVVLPQREEHNFVAEALRHGFYLSRKLDIVPVAGLAPNRVNLELVQSPSEFQNVDNLVLRDADGALSDAYNTFLKDFYLGL